MMPKKLSVNLHIQEAETGTASLPHAAERSLTFAVRVSSSQLSGGQNFSICSSAPQDDNKRQIMDSASVSENGYLDLLLCDIDPVHLFTFSDPKSSGNEGEFFADPEIDTCNYEQFNNMDFLCTMENDENEDELYLSSSARDAYARIAELAEYVLKDQHEKQVEDVFAGSLILDEMVLENTEKFTDVKKQKCHKRTFLSSAENCSDASEPKYKKIVDAPAVSTGNGCFLTMSLNSHSSDCTPLTHQHMPFSATTINALGNFVIPGSSIPLIPESLPLGMKDNRENIDFVDPAQQKINYFLGNGPSNAIKYPALTSSTELMVSPSFQVNLNGLEMYKEVQVPVILSEETSRRPRSVEAFRTSLMDYFRDVCKSVSVEREISLDHMYIDGTLRQSQIETKPGKNSVRSVERDSITYSQKGKEKAVLERSQIFQIPGGKELETKVIVVLGKAGMGKSILVQKICQDWSNGEFPQFEFVFWFDCKQISLPEKWYSLKDLLLDFFVKPQEGSKEIFEYILQNSTKVLLVFDGLEGLHGHENFPHCSASQPNKDLCRMKELLSGLIQKKHVALRLKPDLSFLGIVLTPPDVHVLSSTLKKSRKEFSLDLQNSSIDTHGLKDLVGLKNVTSFRASLSDTIKLWKYLEKTKDYELLRVSTEKFVLDPFKAKTMKDISDLSDLVEMQEIIINSVQDASGCSNYEIPAVKNLRKLEFALGPACGLQGLLKLVEILAAFPSLQHLDLDALSENGIGDEGAKSLSEVFPTLTSLETLNLSQNKITDVGAEKLATALPSLSSLTTLSLYNNSICDFGAENLAKVLPAMASLRVLDIQYNKITGVGAQQLTDSLRKCPHIKNLVMWNPTIPYGVLEHLQQLDSRISV
ncbi:MHC class II transactivator isoform X7 [Meleagris gallopavo]|uniref:MHC class II transactivator isoform X7 n=1 Tax=Meleagris gallopavo TaxID=9103 RepID=UPI0012ABE2FB|nr:MHC class II transactivator isoform X7 [Meleagris gallopavo]